MTEETTPPDAKEEQTDKDKQDYTTKSYARLLTQLSLKLSG
jgi:hypothetical protein